MEWRYPLFDMQFGRAERDAVVDAIRSGWLTMGPATEDVETLLRKRTGSRFAFLVSSGTAALELAADSLGIGAGDEVICPTLTFVACANAFSSRGAKVVFANSLGERDLTVDPEDVARRVTPRTKAIVAVHYAGFPARTTELASIARRHRVALVEDCAHALFTETHGRVLGTIGALGCFSFFSNKNATCGEGGAILTQDAALARRITLLRSHGMTSLTLERHRGHAFSYDVAAVGHNYRLDDLRARLLRVQLERLNGYLAKRRILFREYVRVLSRAGYTVPFADSSDPHTLAGVGVHLAVVLLPPGTNRSRVMEQLRAAGIQTSIHYPCIHRFSAYRRKQERKDLSKTESLADRLLTLPLYPRLGIRDVSIIVAALSEAVARS